MGKRISIFLNTPYKSCLRVILNHIQFWLNTAVFDPLYARLKYIEEIGKILKYSKIWKKNASINLRELINLEVFAYFTFANWAKFAKVSAPKVFFFWIWIFSKREWRAFFKHLHNYISFLWTCDCNIGMGP